MYNSMSFSNQSSLLRPDVIEDVGVLFDPKLSFPQFINCIVKSAYKLYGI